MAHGTQHARYLTSIVKEVALLRCCVQGEDSVIREGSIAHARHVEERSAVGLRALSTTDCHAGVLVRHYSGPKRVVDPLVAVLVHVSPRAEREGVLHVLGTSVDYASMVPAERHALRVAFHEVLPDLGPN